MASIAERTFVESRPPFASALTGIRRRWRLRHVAVGLAITSGVLLLALWGVSVALQQARFSATSLVWARWSVGLLMAAVLARWLVYPQARRISDARLALYVEERVPELGGAVLSAVEVASTLAPDEARSSLLTQGLYADAARRLTRTREVSRIEATTTWRALALALVFLAAGAALVALGPDWIGQSARLLLTPWRDEARSPVYAIAVTPGNATIARGSDFQVSAELRGFTSDMVDLSVRRGAAGPWERVPMGPGADSTRFTARLFDIGEDAEYYVESNGVRSAPFRLTVKDLPAVRRLDLELRFPAYTGLAPEQLEDAGDIAAVRGTSATLRVRANRAVRGGRIMLDGDSSVALVAVDDSTLTGTLKIRNDGFYRVELEAEDGTRVAGNVDYLIDALADLPPQITVRKPGRDARPSNVEEVFIEAEASDDFGVGRMELTYRVNGGAETTIVLSDGRGRRLRELVAGHTIFLEELGLEPGDLVAYYVKAWDNDAVSGAKSVTSDIYFLTIRPFDREYKQNQQGEGGGGGGGEDSPGTLIARQKEVIAATFKSDRDRATTTADAFRSDVTTIHLAQGRLRESVMQLAQRMQRPAVQAADSGFKVIAELLPKAAAEMKLAEEQLGNRKLPDALPPEQRALQLLERAEAVFKEVQVSM